MRRHDAPNAPSSPQTMIGFLRAFSLYFDSLLFADLFQTEPHHVYLFITPDKRNSVCPKSINFQRPPQVSPTDSATSP